MADYIERKDAIKAVADMLAFEAEMDYCDTFTSDDFIDDAKGYFKDIPSADVAPVRYANHGRWKNYKDEHTCSVCDYSFCDEWYSDDDVYNYCPNCGARMDGEDE